MVVSFFIGVLLLVRFWPASTPPQYAAFQITPSPKFPHSSILSGQKAYVAEVGEQFKQDYGDWDARLRVVFDNGTESNLLMRSLHRAM
jgi:hypothetical protein